MCTAVTYRTKDFYFGRTLDVERSYGEKIVVAPRRFGFGSRSGGVLPEHYAIIGMAVVADGHPLYFDAANEHGLAMAGLNFPGNACYFQWKENCDNIAPFEFIPWVLGQCKDVRQARSLLERLNMYDVPFSGDMPLTPLHWMIADREGAIVVESVRDGLKVYDDPVGVLTNNPEFRYHMMHLSDYIGLTNDPPENRFGCSGLEQYSRGMGAIGLPGDLSSASRFVRAAFTRLNAVSAEDEMSSVSQFFHILGAVEHTRGSVRLCDGSYEITGYTSCINADKGIYYYTTYENRCISCVDMHRCDIDGDELGVFELAREQIINRQN